MTDQQQETSTVVATVPTDDEIASIRRTGKRVSAYKKEVDLLAKTIAGLEWGSGTMAVRGSSLSPATQYAFAVFCRITRANPMYHVDVLGGRPYLNANYWADLINSQDHFHHYEQRDLSPSIEIALRNRAEQHRAVAKDLEGEPKAARLGKALDLDEQADEIQFARDRWSPRATATCVVETTIFRFINAAPMEGIKSGKVLEFERYLVTVSECNWAGGMERSMADSKKFDPVGDANPSTTARSRSLRRAATKAFSAWMTPYEEQLRKAEDAVEAEWEVIQDDKAASHAELPVPGGPQAVGTATGEPAAASPEGAKELPVDEPFDANAARVRLFTTLRDAGIIEENRKKWAADNQLPESTKEWGKEQYDRAEDFLVGPVRTKVEAAAAAFGENIADVSLKVLQKDAPQFLSDWNKLAAAYAERADEPAELPL